MWTPKAQVTNPCDDNYLLKENSIKLKRAHVNLICSYRGEIRPEEPLFYTRPDSQGDNQQLVLVQHVPKQ